MKVTSKRNLILISLIAVLIGLLSFGILFGKNDSYEVKADLFDTRTCVDFKEHMIFEGQAFKLEFVGYDKNGTNLVAKFKYTMSQGMANVLSSSISDTLYLVNSTDTTYNKYSTMKNNCYATLTNAGGPISYVDFSESFGSLGTRKNNASNITLTDRITTINKTGYITKAIQQPFSGDSLGSFYLAIIRNENRDITEDSYSDIVEKNLLQLTEEQKESLTYFTRFAYDEYCAPLFNVVQKGQNVVWVSNGITLYDSDVKSFCDDYLRNTQELDEDLALACQRYEITFLEHTNIPLIIKYRDFDVDTNGKKTGKIVWKTIQKEIPSIYAKNKYNVGKYLNIGSAGGGISLSDFDVGETDEFGDSRIEDSYYLVRERLKLVVEDYSVNYNNNQKRTEVEIKYNNLDASDIAIELFSNDPNYPNLKLFIKENERTAPDGNVGYIDFNFSSIVSQAYSQLGWVINAFDMDYVREHLNGGEYYKENQNQNGYWYEFINGSDNTQACLRVHFNTNNQEPLINGCLSLGVKIVPDFIFDVEVNYYNFNFDIANMDISKTKVTDSYDFDDKIRYISLQYMFESQNNGWSNFFNGQSDFYFPAYGNKITNGIPEILKDNNVLSYAGISHSNPELYQNKLDEQQALAEQGKPMTESVGKYIITVLYEYKPAFYINYQTKTNGNTTNSFDILGCSDNTQEVYGADFTKDLTIPKTHRLESIEIYNDYIRTDNEHMKIDYINPNNNKFSLLNTIWSDSTKPTFIPVKVVMSDEMLINFDYFERYKDRKGNITPFATKTNVKDYKVKVADFKDITKPTANELANVLLKNPYFENRLEKDLGLLTVEKTGEPLVRPVDSQTKLLTERSQNGVFYYELTYSAKSLKKQESDGKTFDEVLVGVTKYSDWSKQFSESGEPWNVEMLNHEKASYKLYNSDLEPDELYGLFASIVFEEQVKNVADWFSGVTTDGCVIEYQTKEVKGSEIYQFVTNNKTLLSIALGVGGFLVGGVPGALIGASIPSVIQAGCELVNDDNKTEYAHFFYLDGTTDMVYLSNSKADNYDDNDSAGKNTVEDIINGDWGGAKPYVMIGVAVIAVFVIIVLGAVGSNKIGKIKNSSVKIFMTILLLAVLALIVFGVYKLVSPSIATLFESSTKTLK